jgi:hypothetical protein
MSVNTALYTAKNRIYIYKNTPPPAQSEVNLKMAQSVEDNILPLLRILLLYERTLVFSRTEVNSLHSELCLWFLDDVLLHYGKTFRR